MAGRGPTRQELIRQWRRSGFVGRHGEITAFKDALNRPPEETPQFLFHIHGQAGVGKSTLVRQLENAAREAEALTAYVDESVVDVVEAMAAVSAQFAQQGAALKSFDKLLATYRQRHYEVSAGATTAGTDPVNAAGGADPAGQPPSPSSMVVSQLGLAGLGLIPGVGAFTGAVDPSQVAAGADRVKALLSARLRSQEDVQLVLSPIQALTPVFLKDLAEVARRCPWLVLFFDTYERTGPLLDVWLRHVLVSDRYGEIPANVLVVLSGQQQLNLQRWGDWLDLVTDLPLNVFTEVEARQFLTSKEITDEHVIDVILKLSERLPVLISTLAESRPANAAEVGDPSGTAVERFLKWESDPARRAAALAAALPQELDEDIFRAAVDDEGAGELFSWLQSMPFVTDHAGRCTFHEVVRTVMLRLQRQQSPARWRVHHTRLADSFRQRRTLIETPTNPNTNNWEDAHWRSLRIQETYHRLCADPGTALSSALREALDAYTRSTSTFRRWAQTFIQAGQDTDSDTVSDWGKELLRTLENDQPGIAAISLVLSRAELDTLGRSKAHSLRGQEHRRAGKYDQALVDYNAALSLEPENSTALRGRGETHRLMSHSEKAISDFTRSIEIQPAEIKGFTRRGLTYESMGSYEEALVDYTHAIEIDPTHAWACAHRGLTYESMGSYEKALADYTHAIETDPTYTWALISRGNTYESMKRYEEALADYTHAIETDPTTYTWALTNRGSTYHSMKRYEEALADYTRAAETDPTYTWALISRGNTYRSMGSHEEALADYTRAIEIDPNSPWALTNRGDIYHYMKRYEEALADLTRAIVANPNHAWALISQGRVYESMGLYEESLAKLTHAIEIEPNSFYALSSRSVIYRLMGNYEEALRDSFRATELQPDHAWSLANRGVTYRYMCRYEEAIAPLARALEIKPDETWFLYERGVALHALGNPDGKNQLEQLIEHLSLDSTRETPHISDTGNLFLACCAICNWESAERYLGDFLSEDPSRGNISELLAATRSLDQATRSSGNNLTYFCIRLGDAFSIGGSDITAWPTPTAGDSPTRGREGP
ncbi:tetratricopeptide repeat protein [Streptomyces sp. NPDC055239]